MEPERGFAPRFEGSRFLPPGPPEVKDAERAPGRLLQGKAQATLRTPRLRGRPDRSRPAVYQVIVQVYRTFGLRIRVAEG